MANVLKDVRALALARMAGFRHKSVFVPEWEGAKIILREPSAEGWLRWQEIVRPELDGEELGLVERAQRNLKADVTLFIDVLCDGDKQPVFSLEDTDEVTASYGPVHSRLLKQALDLITTADEAKKN